MVYENVPEHAGFNKKGAKEAYEAERAQAAKTDSELLASIDANLQRIVDAMDTAMASGDGADDGARDGKPTEDSSKDEIQAYADSVGVDLAGHKGSKADMLAHIEAEVAKRDEVTGD